MFYSEPFKKKVESFYQYKNNFKEEDMELAKAYTSKTVNTELLIVKTVSFGNLIQLPKKNGYVDKMKWAITNSNEVCWKFNLFSVSETYLLDTSLSLSEKVGYRNADSEKWSLGFNYDTTIKVISASKVFDDDNGISINTGSIIKGDVFGEIYTYSGFTLNKFDRNGLYLVCFGLGEPFK